MLLCGLLSRFGGIVLIAECSCNREQYIQYSNHDLKDFTILQNTTPPFLYAAIAEYIIETGRDTIKKQGTLAGALLNEIFQYLSKRCPTQPQLIAPYTASFS